MGYAIVTRAMEIIFLMEGKYSSVNADDNGAVSVGACQWHGSRAKLLLQKIIKLDEETAVHLLAKYLVSEIKDPKISWTKRTLDGIEKMAVSMLLDTHYGRLVQDKTAYLDIQGYINHCTKCGIAEEESLIFMADIENQGGAGASSRIIKQAIKDYGQDVTLEQLVITTSRDKVFCNYMVRRKQVYKKLTGQPFMSSGSKVKTYTVVKGDTLTKIAKRHHTPINFIYNFDATPIKDINKIFVGQKLIISYPDNVVN